MEIELSRLVDALPGLAWTTRPDGSSAFVNQRWREYAGLTLDEVRARGWETAVHPDDLTQAQERWSALLAAGTPGEVEVRIRRFDGEYRRFQIKTCPLVNANGRIAGWCGINTETEDHRRAEEALLAQESRFQFIFEGLPAMVTLMTPEGLLEQGNQNMLDYFGRTLEELKARPVGYSFHPDDRPEVMSRWRRSVATGAPYDYEARLRRADGVYRWFHTRGFPLRDVDGRIFVWCLLQEDIDERRRAEALLAGEKSLLEKIARRLPLSSVLDDLSLLVEDLAPGCYCSILLVDPGGDRFRFGSGPSLPSDYIEIVDGESIDPNHSPYSLAVVLKAPVITMNLANDPQWTSSAWRALMAEHGLASCWSMPIVSAGQHVLGAFAVYRREPEGPTSDEQDLVDRFTKIAGVAIERARGDAALEAREAELLQANRYLLEAQKLSKSGSFTRDITREQINWSDGTYRIWEFDPASEITIERLLNAIHPEDLPTAKAAMSVAAEGKDFEIFFRIVTAGGAVKHIHTVGHRMEHIADRLVFIGATQDVTESKVAEEALNRARAELAHVARAAALSALTASIAHEVNQPLAGIITNASTCLRMLAADPPNLDGARATAQRIIRDGNRASRVIQRLRALFARKTPGMEPVDINDAAREVLALSSGDLQHRRITVRTDYADDLPHVRGDRVQLQQVILNLVLNAADAMSGVEGGPRDLWLVTARGEAGQATLSVRDSGIGIEPENLERLFDAFYTTKSGGMGIGLSICRSIIESHNGRLLATTNEGPGATFFLSIPSEPPPGDVDPCDQGAGAKQVLRGAAW